jgi:hypothetical protein
MGTLLSLEDFDLRFRVLHDAIFRTYATEGAFFRDPAWKVVLLPYGIRMSCDDFSALSKAAQRLGDDQLILIDIESISPSPMAAMVSWDYCELKKLRFQDGTNFSLLDTHLFGCSGRWGAISACSLDDILVLGGDKDFMSVFIPSAGGIEALRSRFLDFASDSWRVSEVISQQLVKLAGWDSRGS